MNLRLSFLAAATLLTSAALADDVTLNVPVNVKNLMPEVGDTQVTCWLYDSNQKALVNGSSFSSLAPVDASGNYSGTAQVKITLGTGELANAKSYQCDLTLTKPGGVGIARFDPNPGIGACATITACKPKPGAPFVGWVTGPIPHAQGVPVIMK